MKTKSPMPAIVVVLGCASGCARGVLAQGPEFPPVRAESNGVSVAVDPRIELMTAIQLLAGYPILTSHDTPYRSDVAEYFAPHRAHQAVAYFDTLFESGFAFDAVPKSFASMSSLPELELTDAVPREALAAAGGRPQLERLALLASELAQRSKLAAFYRSHEGTYRRLVDSTLSQIVSGIAHLTEYTGVKIPEARVVLSPLIHDGGFAMAGTPPQAFIGPRGIGPDGFPDFGGAARLGPLIWHEFAHTIINPLTESQRDKVDALEIVDEEFRTRMRRNAYADWSTIVNESIIRAIEVRLTARILGDDAARRAQERQVERGFIHVPRIVEILHLYEADRDSFPTIADFYPRVLNAFESVPRWNPADPT
jgi:hypothetical protein